MKKPENRVIDGTEYLIYHMGPKDQLRTLKFIAKTVGSPLGMLVDKAGSASSKAQGEGVEAKRDFLDSDASIISDFIKEALAAMDDEEAIIKKIEVFLQYAQKKNAQGNFVAVSMEKDFHGELIHMFKVVKDVLEVNFGSFLGVSAELVEKVRNNLTTKFG